MSPWYTFGSADGYLAVYGDYNNAKSGIYFPSLHYKFATAVDEAWSRFTLRTDESTHTTDLFMGLVFQESIEDSYYFGTGLDDFWNTLPSIQINLATSFVGYSAHVYNTSNRIWSGSSLGGAGVGTLPKIDLHVLRTSGYIHSGDGNVGGVWTIEVYEDGVLRYSGSDTVWGDTGHPLGAAGIKGLVIEDQYASYSGYFVAIDDVSAGTTQGASDLMTNAPFTTDTSPLVRSIFDKSGVGSDFQIKYAGISSGGNPTRTISGASGSYNDDNSSVVPTGSGTSYDIVGNGIFYKWTAPSNGLVTVRTDPQGLGSDIGDTVLYVLPNNTTLTPQTDAIAFNDDDHGPYYSLTTFTAVAGTTYYFLAKGYSTVDIGTYTLSWTY